MELEISSEQTQQVINSITDAYKAEGQDAPIHQGLGGPGPFGFPPQGFPPPGFPPPGMPMGMPPPPFMGRGGRKWTTFSSERKI